jgi:flagellar biosynthetic protein FliQ
VTDATVLQLLNQMLVTTALLCAPVLGVALVVGVAISILQAATQVQEMTLTYVPKMLAVALVLGLLGPWMLHQMVSYSSHLLEMLPQYAR